MYILCLKSKTVPVVVEREKKKKLPANRVGAKFDHQQSTDQAWLPSFGRVWSKGGRQQSKSDFHQVSKCIKIFIVLHTATSLLHLISYLGAHEH